MCNFLLYIKNIILSDVFIACAAHNWANENLNEINTLQLVCTTRGRAYVTSCVIDLTNGERRVVVHSFPARPGSKLPPSFHPPPPPPTTLSHPR